MLLKKRLLELIIIVREHTIQLAQSTVLAGYEKLEAIRTSFLSYLIYFEMQINNGGMTINFK
jgi:hypothetical protein